MLSVLNMQASSWLTWSAHVGQIACIAYYSTTIIETTAWTELSWNVSTFQFVPCNCTQGLKWLHMHVRAMITRSDTLLLTIAIHTPLSVSILGECGPLIWSVQPTCEGTRRNVQAHASWYLQMTHSWNVHKKWKQMYVCRPIGWGDWGAQNPPSTSTG